MLRYVNFFSRAAVHSYVHTYIALLYYNNNIYYGRASLKIAIILLPLLGITWVVGILAVNEHTIVFAWIFTILNSLQVCINIIHQLTWLLHLA